MIHVDRCRMSDVAHTNASRLMIHVDRCRMSDVAHTNASRHSSKSISPYIGMGVVVHINESCHRHQHDMTAGPTHQHMTRVTHVNALWNRLKTS